MIALSNIKNRADLMQLADPFMQHIPGRDPDVGTAQDSVSLFPVNVIGSSDKENFAFSVGFYLLASYQSPLSWLSPQI